MKGTLSLPGKKAAASAKERLAELTAHPTPKQVRGVLSSIQTEAQSIVDKAEAENNGAFTDEQSERFDALMAEKNRAQIMLAEAEDLEARGGPGHRLTDPGQPGDPVHGPRRYPSRDAGRASAIWTPDGRATFAQLFGDAAVDDNGFREASEFFRIALSGRHDDRLQSASSSLDVMPEAATHNTYEGTSGGYLVPPAFSAMLLDSSLEEEVVRPRADVMPMDGPSLGFPVWDNFDRTSGIGGFGGQWLGEGEAGTDETANFRRMLLVAHKMIIYSAATSEVLEDGVNFQAHLFEKMRESLSWILDYAYLRGTGSGEPLGILNSPSLVTVPKESGQAADTISYANIAKMYARMHPTGQRRATWVANPTAIPQLLQTFPSDGTVGGGNPVLRQEANGAFTMMGRPLLISEKLPTLGEAGDVIYCDFSQYAIGMRREVNLEFSNGPGWSTDVMKFRLKVRSGGQGKWHAAITPKNGDSLSWAVALGERA